MLSVENLSKSYDDRTVVQGVSFQVPKGGAFGFLGVNGAGKTTTMKMIVGLVQPTAGAIRLDGQPLDGALRNQIGFMPEGPYFYENLTGLELLAFYGGLFSHIQTSAKDQRALLIRLGLGEAADRPIRTYSKGMRQRFGFAQALVNNPQYVFLDEPLDGLDPLGRRQIKEIILGMKKEGKTVFLNSHILSDIEEICDTIGVIHAGELIYSGSVAEFCQNIPLEQRFVELISKQSKPSYHE